MARHRSRSKTRNPRRRTRRATGGWIKRHGKWCKGAMARGGRVARRARRSKGRSSRTGTRGRRGGRWTERRARKKARFYQRRFSKSRRNPGASHFTDGTVVQISGDTVTVITPYGETYEYSEVDARARGKVMTARTASQARKILNGAGVLASINPKRGKKSRRYRIMDRSPGYKARRGRKPRSRRNCGRY